MIPICVTLRLPYDPKRVSSCDMGKSRSRNLLLKKGFTSIGQPPLRRSAAFGASPVVANHFLKTTYADAARQKIRKSAAMRRKAPQRMIGRAAPRFLILARKRKKP